MNETVNLCERVTNLISNCDDFTSARKVARSEFIRQFTDLPEEKREVYPKAIFSWAMNKLHSREINDRVAALTGLAFYINLVDKDQDLEKLVTQLERILPAENVCIINGIAYIFEHIYRKVPSTFLPRLFERCASWISTRPTPHAVLSSAILMKHLYFCTSAESQVSSKILPQVINSAFKFDNEEVQRIAVDLYLMSHSRDPSVDESTRSFINDCIVVLDLKENQESGRSHAHGCLLLLETLMEKQRRITMQRFHDFFPPFLRYLQRTNDDTLLSFLAFFSEQNHEGAKVHTEKIITIITQSNFDYSKEYTCGPLCRMIKVFPDELSSFGFEVAKKMKESAPQMFFELSESVLKAKKTEVDTEIIFQAFVEAQELSNHLLTAMDSFITVFPHYIFRVIRNLHPKLTSAISDESNTDLLMIGLECIRIFAKYPQFSVSKYWDTCKRLMIHDNEDVRISAIKCLFTISSHSSSPDASVAIHILFMGQNDESKRVRRAICEEFPDAMLSVFTNMSAVSLIEQFIDDESSKVAEHAIHLLGRIKKAYPLNVINIFWQRLVSIEVDYFHTDLVREKKKIIEKLPFLLQEAEEFSTPLHKEIIRFIKKLLLTKPPLNQTLAGRINHHRDEKCDRVIRLSCMKSIRVIGRDLANVTEEIASLAKIILSQLHDNLHPEFQTEVANTLRSIFKWVDVIHETDLDILNFQMEVMKFVQTTDNPDVINAFIKLLGTIGPLDPYRFHDSKVSSNTFDSSLICDPSKREKCYLDFVMGYIIDQLNSKSRNHEPTTLINAIVYIFQNDAKNCTQYLDQIIKIFVDLFNLPKAPYDSLFTFLRQIILLVDVMILPHAESIMNIIDPFIPTGKSISAIKTLNALIFSLKSEFKKFSSNVFKTVVNILHSKEHIPMEMKSSLLLTLTLLTIYTDGCAIEFYKHIQIATERNDNLSQYAFTFLSQAIASGSMKTLVVKSLKLALSHVNGKNTPPYVCDLIYVLVAKYSNIVLQMPVELEGISPEIDKLIEDIKSGTIIDILKSPIASKLLPTPDPYGMRPKTQFESKSISSVFQQGRFKSSATENNWTAWALNFAQELSLCSKSPAIRACLPLLMSSTTLHLNIFPLIFLSVWENASEEERNVLSSYIKHVVSMNVPQSILQLISATCEELDRANFTLFPNEPLEAGRISEKCNSWFRALHFYGLNYEEKEKDTITILLRIETQLKRKECAIGLQSLVAKEDKSCELLESLNMWSVARDIYAQKFAKNERDESNLVGLLKCSVPMDDWKVITDRFSDFPSYSRELQNELGTIFGAAAISTGQDENKFLDAVLEDTPEFCYWRTISAINNKKFDEALVWVQRGRSYLVRNDESFSSGNYEPAIPAITYSMIFEELEDVVHSYTSKEEKLDKMITSLWNRKLDYLRRDPTWLRMIYRARILLNTSKEEELKMKLEFFNFLRRQNEWGLYDKLIGKRLPIKDPRVRILQEKVRFDRGLTNDLSGFLSLINEFKQHYSTDVYCQAVCSYASRTTDLAKAHELLEDVVKTQPANIHAWKYYAYTNLRLSEDATIDKCVYANNALIGFISLVELKQMSMHYLCQLCSLFFNYGTSLKDFNQAATTLINLPPKCILSIMPQILTQYSHPTEEVRNVVFKIIESLSEKNYQSLAFSLNLIRQLDDKNSLISLVDKIESKNVQVSTDLKGFAESLIYLAALPLDRFIDILKQVELIDKQVKIECKADPKEYERIIFERTKNVINDLVKLSHEELTSFNKALIIDSQKSLWDKVNNMLKGGSRHSAQFITAAKNALNYSKRFLDSLISIDIDEMNVKLSHKKNFSIAVPGTQCIGESLVTVEHVNHIMKTLPSTQHPRKMTLIGSDGHIYRYVLKGRQDLRLDQHVMQLFSLVNSIIKEDKFSYDLHCSIMQYGITPLSSSSGLISWAEGGKTLYSMIKWYRKLRRFPLDIENQIYVKYKKSNPTSFTPELRLQMFKELCDASPPDQLKQVLWLRSPSAESWLTQATNFARSTSLMSFVGYIIGLGDRHTSNILVMKNLGNVVHIDLSDCFEKAALRPVEPETVPFRLTRMIIDSLGPSNVHGVFEVTAECVMNALKRNQATILAFLDIFAKENVIDVAWYEDETTKKYSGVERTNALFKKAIQVINNKLNQTELNEPENTTTAEHVAKLISIATDPNNLSQMYYGWSPYW